MKTHNKRFELFAAELRRELGDRASLLANDRVLIHRNEFSPEQEFSTLQAAIDHYARYMPEELK